MKNHIFISLLFCIISINLSAQNKLSGTLIDKSNNERIAFANVALFRTSDSVFVIGIASDYQGAFSLNHIPSGNYELKVSAIGFELYKQKIQINKDIDLGKITMQPGAITLNEIEIVEKKPLFANEGEKTLYNVSEDPSIQTGTASDALQNAPGVEVDVEGNITLRGVSSVEIWINDKPSHLNAENLKTYLQQLPANSIERVEVITNPSARYASKSDGGIINIVTNAKVKRNEFISFGANASTNPYTSPWVSYVWANEKISFNAYANLYYSNWHGINNSYYKTFINDSVGDLSLANHSIDTADFISNNLGGGINMSLEYNIDSMNQLSVWVGAWPTTTYGTYFTKTSRYEYLGEDKTYQYTDASNNLSKSAFGYGGLYFLHKFDNKGHNLTVSVNTNLNSYNTDNQEIRQYSQPYDYLKDKKLNSKNWGNSISADVDYTKPYSKNGEISLGYSTSYNSSNQILVFDTLNSGIYVEDSLRSYIELSNSYNNDLYFTLQHKFGNFVIKPGIRMEHESITFEYPEAATYNFSKPFLSLRPSLHLSYRTKSMHNFSLSYSRRVSNPTDENISNFIKYAEDSFSIGNPDLKSTFTHSLEGSWTKYWEKFGSVGITGYYRSQTNRVDNVEDSRYDSIWNRVVSFTQPINVGKSHRTGAEFNITYRPTALFNMRLYANVYDSYIETYYKKLDSVVSSSMISYSFSLNMWTKVWNKLEIHCSAYYNSPTESLFSRSRGRYGINSGLRADFFDRKMSMFLNVNDIFNWNSRISSTYNPYYESYNSSKYNSRSISLGITFRFGKMELEHQAKQGGNEPSAPSL